MDVVIQSGSAPASLDVDGLRRFLESLAAACPADGRDSLGVSLVDDETMRAANRRFRGRDRTTDVLSFPGEPEPAPDGTHSLGDVMVSVPAAVRQAAERGHGLARELQLLLIHGYLHLMGYDHETDEGDMDRLERTLRERLLTGTAS